MVSSLMHERFYTSGVWSDENAGVYLGWAERENSFACKKPVWNERGNLALFFSGEEFPEPGASRRLEEQGHDLSSEKSSYLVHLAESEPSFPANLNGRFHGVLVDGAAGKTFLFNDRYGMHRLYIYQSPDAFYFAAEAKAILAVCPETRALDHQSLGEFISCGAVLEDRSLFKGVQALPPASLWQFRSGSMEVRGKFFDSRDWELQEPLDNESFFQELKSAFVGNLPRYFAGPETIAMSLTGGLDTRMILASHKPQAGTLPCYTFGSMYRENQDVRVASRVARLCGQTHEVITAGDHFLSQFSHYAERSVYLSDGCVDVGRSADLYLNEKAREIAPVRMTGNYGGEVLRGVRAFKPSQPAPGIFSDELAREIQNAQTTYDAVRNCNPVSFAVFKQGPWYLRSVLTLEQSQLSMRSPYLDNDFVRAVFRASASVRADNDASLRLIAEGNRELLKIPTDRGVACDRKTLSSIAIHAVLEFLFKAEYAYDMGMPEWLARIDHSLRSLRLERAFLGRHKPFHFRVWYRDRLAKYVQEILLDPQTLARPFVDRKGLEAAVEGHLKGNQNYTNEIHKVVTVELIHRLFLDEKGRDDGGSCEIGSNEVPAHFATD